MCKKSIYLLIIMSFLEIMSFTLLLKTKRTQNKVKQKMCNSETTLLSSTMRSYSQTTVNRGTEND